jgi:hypothetical protein
MTKTNAPVVWKQVVWKYPIALVADEQVIGVPVRSRCVHVAIQHGVITMWRLVEDPNTEMTDRRFVIRGTGHPVEEQAMHLGTVLDGAFVWHLFEVFR